MPVHVRIIFILIFSLLLTGCAELAPTTATPVIIPETSAVPAASETVTASPGTGVPETQPDSTPTTVPTQAAIIEPVLPPLQVDPAIPPVNPPNFDEAMESRITDHGAFDLIDAHAMYAYYRQEVGIGMWSDSDFIQTMETYYETVLKPQGIELKQASAAGVTYSLLTRQTDQGWEMLLGFTPKGALAHMQPGLWGEDITQEWVPVSNVLKGPAAIFIGADNLAYITRLGLDGKVYDLFNPIGATRDNLGKQWVPVRNGEVTLMWDVDEGAWVKNYDTTEYTGIFSEKYGAPEFTDSFIYTHASGIEVPIHIGLDVDGLPGSADDLPIKEVHLTELGQELLGELWLAACYYRYTEIMGNDVTMEEYLALVEAGEGQVEAYFIDEITGEKKIGLIDPKNGVSITLTGRDDLPLEQTPDDAKNAYYTHHTFNKNGMLIIVQNQNLQASRDYYNGSVIKDKWPADFHYMNEYLGGYEGAIFYFSILDASIFSLDGQTKTRPPKEVQSVHDKYMNLFPNINVFKDDHPFGRVIVKP